MKTLILCLMFILTQGQEASIDGSSAEAMKLKNVLHVKWQEVMDTQKFENFNQVYEPNATMIVNGNKPIKGLKAAIQVFHAVEDMGPDAKIRTLEYIVSKSNDLGTAMGLGEYMNMEGGYIIIFKKYSGRWLIHINAFHEWNKGTKKEKKIPTRVKRQTPEIVGNSGVANEVQAVIDKWVQYFRADDAKGLTDLYTENCVVMDNTNKPKRGKQSVQASFKKMLTNYGNQLTNSLEGITTSTAGDLAAAYGSWNDEGTTGNHMFVLKREGTELKIHYSIFSNA